MGIKTIPLSRLEANLRATLSECADSGEAVVVELPDQRLIAIQALEAADDDSLVDELLKSNTAFRAIVAKSKSGTRKPFLGAQGGWSSGPTTLIISDKEVRHADSGYARFSR